jgi:hypothetical protein
VPPEIVIVRVVEVSGDVAYVEPGAASGLRTGQAVLFGPRRFVVVAVSQRSAALALRGETLALAAEGRARLLTGARAERKHELLRARRTLAHYRGQWPRAALPARARRPKPVPLGPILAERAAELVLAQRNSAIVPLARPGSALGRGELRARLRADVLPSAPLAVRADASLLWWWARSALPATRPPAIVRELELRYGTDAGGLLRTGRLASPAPALGTLDGARAQSARLGAFTLGAFGGLLPDALDDAMRTDASRFGIDLAYDAPEQALRPHAALVVHGSTFEGELDERRLGLFAGVAPGPARVHGGLELSLYPRHNAFQADPLEVTLGYADAVIELGALRAGARFHTYLPERSRRLDAELDRARLCSTDPRETGCSGELPRRIAAGPELGVELGALRVDASASAVTQPGAPLLDHIGGDLILRLSDPLVPSGALHGSGLQLAGSLLRDPFYDRIGARLGVDARLAQPLDLGLGYEPALMRYANEDEPRLTHGVELWLSLGIGRELHLVLQSELVLGDVEALYLTTLVQARP